MTFAKGKAFFSLVARKCIHEASDSTGISYNVESSKAVDTARKYVTCFLCQTHSLVRIFECVSLVWQT